MPWAQNTVERQVFVQPRCECRGGLLHVSSVSSVGRETLISPEERGLGKVKGERGQWAGASAGDSCQEKRKRLGCVCRLPEHEEGARCLLVLTFLRSSQAAEELRLQVAGYAMMRS